MKGEPRFVCGKGYVGDDELECVDEPGCEGHDYCGDGVCNDVPAPGNRWTCTCPTGEVDQDGFCDHNDCLSDSCANGGTCVDKLWGSFSCNCVGGYAGDTCTRDMRGSSSCSQLLAAGFTESGLYYINPDPTVGPFEVYCDMETDGGGWTLVMTTSATSPWTYGNAVWTANDNSEGRVPTPSDETDKVSRAFYKLYGTETKICLSQYDAPTVYSCSNILHASNTPRGLANGSIPSSTQSTTNLLPSAIRACVGGNRITANTYHRWGWNPGYSSHGGARLGFTADNDSSDSMDSYIGFGLQRGSSSGGAYESGSGYCQYPAWSPAPTPMYAGLKGRIWFRSTPTCQDLLIAGDTVSGVKTLGLLGSVYCDMTTDGGGWALVMYTPSTSSWTYSNAVWTNTDDTSGMIPQPSSSTNQVSRAFYLSSGRDTKLCLTQFNAPSVWGCSAWRHAENTPRGLANGSELTSTQATNGLLPASIRACTGGGLWAAPAWHRWGWNTGMSSHGGARIGHSADGDSSDSQDSFIGMGCTRGSGGYNAWEGGAGYAQWSAWTPAPSPLYSALSGQIWFRAGFTCYDLLKRGVTTSGLYTTASYGQVYCDMDTNNDGGGWTLVMRVQTTSSYTYDNAVWTNTDDTTGQVPQPADTTNKVSRAFYQMYGTQTRLCLTQYDATSTWACSTISHSSNTPRALANGSAITSSQTTTGLLPSTLRAVTRGGLWCTNSWHRFGWNTGKGSHGGCRLGFSSDNDSSDNQDSTIGIGTSRGSSSGGAAEYGAGYCAWPAWCPSLSPANAALQGAIWFR